MSSFHYFCVTLFNIERYGRHESPFKYKGVLHEVWIAMASVQWHGIHGNPYMTSNCDHACI